MNKLSRQSLENNYSCFFSIKKYSKLQIFSKLNNSPIEKLVSVVLTNKMIFFFFPFPTIGECIL